MNTLERPFVHVSIDSVDTVTHDPDRRIDPELYDHYATFGEARDAALSCVELLLDEGDYDGDDHREELERMKNLLENASDFVDLERQPGYQWFIQRWTPVTAAA